MRADRGLAGGSHEQRIAVGRGGGCQLRADHAVGARLVHQLEGLAKERPDRFAEVARRCEPRPPAACGTMNRIGARGGFLRERGAACREAHERNFVWEIVEPTIAPVHADAFITS